MISWLEKVEKRREWCILLHRSSIDSFAMAFFLTLFLVNYWTLYGAASELAMEVMARRPEEVLHSRRKEKKKSE